jgi:chromosome partitioning protein
MGKIIAIVTQKGGVGKTTTTINLAACLAAAEKKTLIIDFDPQGNASAGLGIDRESRAYPNVYHVLMQNFPIEQAIKKTALSHLHILTADSNLSGAPVELVNEIARESKLKRILAKIKDQYDFILIDCAPSVCLLTINALNTADTYLIPMQTEFYAMEGLADTLNLVKMIKESLNDELKMEGVLLTLFDGRSNLHKQVAQEVQNHFGDYVYKTIIPKNVKLSESPSFGKPIILYDIESKGSEAYLSLTKEFLVRQNKTSEHFQTKLNVSENNNLNENSNSIH